MASGVLGKAMSNNATPVVAYTVPLNAVFATASVNLTNTGPVDAKVKVALTTSVSPGLMDYVEFDAVIPAMGGSLERSCMVLSPGEKVIIECDMNTVAIRVYGLEEIPA